jgi:hypothetical protein
MAVHARAFAKRQAASTVLLTSCSVILHPRAVCGCSIERLVVRIVCQALLYREGVLVVLPGYVVGFGRRPTSNVLHMAGAIWNCLTAHYCITELTERYLRLAVNKGERNQ